MPKMPKMDKDGRVTKKRKTRRTPKVRRPTIKRTRKGVHSAVGFQGREATLTLQAPTRKELNDLIERFRVYAEDFGMEDFKVLKRGKDPDGGFIAIVTAHNTLTQEEMDEAFKSWEKQQEKKEYKRGLGAKKTGAPKDTAESRRKAKQKERERAYRFHVAKEERAKEKAAREAAAEARRQARAAEAEARRVEKAAEKAEIRKEKAKEAARERRAKMVTEIGAGLGKLGAGMAAGLIAGAIKGTTLRPKPGIVTPPRPTPGLYDISGLRVRPTIERKLVEFPLPRRESE